MAESASRRSAGHRYRSDSPRTRCSRRRPGVVPTRGAGLTVADPVRPQPRPQCVAGDAECACRVCAVAMRAAERVEQCFALVVCGRWLAAANDCLGKVVELDDGTRCGEYRGLHG